MRNDGDDSKVIRKKGSYSISAVAEMFDIHQQTIRLYEKQGLISPSRSSGNTRKFTEEDVAQLEEVIYLTHNMGVNLAGVNMILKLKKKMKRMQTDMNSLFDQAEESLRVDEKIHKTKAKESLDRLMEMKQENKEKSSLTKNKFDKISNDSLKDWLSEEDEDNS